MNSPDGSTTLSRSLEPSTSDIEAMLRDGFVVVSQFFSKREAEEISQWTDELSNAPEVSGSHWVYHEKSLLNEADSPIQRIENFCPYHQGFGALIEQGNLRRWASALMGGPVELFKDKINFKMPGGAGFKAHQDQQAGWSRYAPIFLTAMVSIDATTIENGCLEIAPRPYGSGLIGAEWTPLEEEPLALKPVLTQPGDVIFFDSFVPHGSKPNLTSAARRALYLTFNLAQDGDHRAQYFADKHAAFPPDIDREADKSYVFRV